MTGPDPALLFTATPGEPAASEAERAPGATPTARAVRAPGAQGGIEVPSDPDDILRGLDPEQLAVARSPLGPMCVLAGAGTGKTRAITHRIAYGVAAGLLVPQRVLAVTFTARAAGEMRTRLRTLGARRGGGVGDGGFTDGGFGGDGLGRGGFGQQDASGSDVAVPRLELMFVDTIE